MATRVFFFNRLHSDAGAEEYERWVRNTDYPEARALAPIASYDVIRLEGPLRGDEAVPYDYVEVVEISDLAEYRDALGRLPPEFVAQWRSFVSESTAVHGTLIE